MCRQPAGSDVHGSGQVQPNNRGTRRRRRVRHLLQRHNVTWRITLNDGWTFHDGTDVAAESFVRAWNWSAYRPNAQPDSYFFEPIKGFADVQGEDANGYEKITADEASVTEMSGLTVVSDTEFTVELAAPSSVFPVMLASSRSRRSRRRSSRIQRPSEEPLLVTARSSSCHTHQASRSS